MWLLNFLPGWFFHLMIFAGILGYVASVILTFIPSVNLYKSVIRVLSTLIIVVGVWFAGVSSGTLSNEEKWQARVKEAEEKVKEADMRALELNDQLTKVLNDKIVIREEKTKTITKYIDSWITKEILREVEGPERVKIEKVIEYIERCPIPKELLDIHNQAAKGEGMKK
jgi:hypothetical protein